MERGDFFKGILQWEMTMKDLSLEGKLPTFYYENTAMTAIFTASAAKVQRLLPHADMHPVPAWPGRALAAFTAFEYRKTDIDPYNEFSISFPITWGRKPLPGITMLSMMVRRTFTAYVWQLPVTTERARRGGVDMFGYPKFIADIVFSHENDALRCTLSEGGQNILVLEGRKLATGMEKVIRFKTYSIKDGVPLLANVYIRPIAFGQSMGSTAARLSLGTHDIARKLKELDLSSRPLLFQYLPVMEAILFGPRNLIDD